MRCDALTLAIISFRKQPQDFTRPALQRAQAAMVMSIAADIRRADLERQQAQAQQQQISKILAIVQFVETLNMQGA